MRIELLEEKAVQGQAVKELYSTIQNVRFTPAPEMEDILSRQFGKGLIIKQCLRWVEFRGDYIRCGITGLPVIAVYQLEDPDNSGQLLDSFTEQLNRLLY